MTTDIVQLKEKENQFILKHILPQLMGLNHIKDMRTKHIKNYQKEPLDRCMVWRAAGNGQVPSKSLSQCENGWILQWQEYQRRSFERCVLSLFLSA